MKIKATFLNCKAQTKEIEIEVRDLTDKIVEMSINGFSLQSIHHMPEGAIMKSYLKHLQRLQDAEDFNKFRKAA
jgi:hypothetical protein